MIVVYDKRVDVAKGWFMESQLPKADFSLTKIIDSKKVKQLAKEGCNVAIREVEHHWEIWAVNTESRPMFFDVLITNIKTQ